jgi:hypothetical protein
MASITIYRDEREPGVLQVFAQDLDASLAALSASRTSTWWLPVPVARELHRLLGEKLEGIDR